MFVFRMTRTHITRKIFINGLNSQDHSLSMIYDVFRNYGQITDITIKEKHLDDGSCRMFAFIAFKNRDIAKECLESTKNGLNLDNNTRVNPQPANVSTRSRDYRKHHGKRKKVSPSREAEKRNQELEEKKRDEARTETTTPNESTSIANETKQNELQEELIGSDTDFFDCY